MRTVRAGVTPGLIVAATCTSCGGPFEQGHVEQLAPGYSHRAHLICRRCGKPHLYTGTLRPEIEDT